MCGYLLFVTRFLAQTIATPLLYLILPELETPTQREETPKLLVVPRQGYDIPRFVRGWLEIRVDSTALSK